MNHTRSATQLSDQEAYDAFFGDPNGDIYATLEGPGVEPRDMPDDASFHLNTVTALSELGDDHEQHSLQLELSRRASFASTNPFRDEQHRRSSSIMHHRSVAGWHPLNSASGTVSPQALGHYSSSGDHHENASVLHMSVPAGFVPIDHTAGDGQSNHTSTSPYSNPDCMDIVAQEYSGRNNTVSRHATRAGSRPSRPAPSRSNSDGVRKKNTRIDIPADRNLTTIEEMIERAQDEDELRELKAQRRLLRNREAALASRQRKKQHTEDLEIREQSYTKQVNILNSQLAELRRVNGSVTNELNDLHEKHANAVHLLTTREMEKEELTLKYTQENGSLRRKLAYLLQQRNLTTHDNDYMMTSNPDLNHFTSDMSALNVNQQQAWMSGHDNHFNVEPQQQSRPAAAHQDMKPIKQEPEQPQVASGVLFMILLCGAFVASKGGGGKHLLPRLPDEVRVASNTVLDTLLRDPRADTLAAGNMQPPSMPVMHHQDQMQEDMLQPHNQWQQSGQQSGPAHDPRQNLYRSLTMPSGQQEAEQIFQMTPSEYNTMTSTDSFVTYHPHQTLTPHRNLAESLASARSESIFKGSAAEVYTRSLLWDHIPHEIVRQFRELVMDSNMSE